MSFNPNVKASKNFSYYPPGLYYALANVAHDHDISIKEVETVLIRTALREHGFKCNHPQGKIKTAKRTGKSYCAWCWTRLAMEMSSPQLEIRDRKVRFPSKRYFLLCQRCFWCVSCLGKGSISECPRCNNTTLDSIPIHITNFTSS
jgi:hypothetical protein